ncbi:hypothetical protein BJV78DRAFT_1284525 [Lactifluus subvellereus]|nr:hypothetical protein BJV78DRAFT_1284525 [Lactifluus subvellereus]
MTSLGAYFYNHDQAAFQRQLAAAPPTDINARDWLGRTVLHLAVNLQEESHWTALHRALYNGMLAAAYVLCISFGTDTGCAGSSQMPPMAIVEGVMRQNRAAWDRANAGLPAESAITAGTVSGLVSVRAPPRQYNIRGEGGRGIAFETVSTPGSVLAAS